MRDLRRVGPCRQQVRAVPHVSITFGLSRRAIVADEVAGRAGGTECDGYKGRSGLTGYGFFFCLRPSLGNQLPQRVQIDRFCEMVIEARGT